MRNSSDTGFLTDEMVIKIAKELGINLPDKPTKDNRIKTSLKKIGELEKGGSLTKMGTGFVRIAHDVWKMEKEGDDIFLLRVKPEEEKE